MTKKFIIEDMKELALKKNGQCLSQRYINANSNLEWQCSKGHRWKATPGSIKNQGSWCKRCSTQIIAQKLRLSLKDVQNVAKARHGKCISTSYVNSHVPLNWQCAKGHIWAASLSSIKSSNSWCGICSGHPVLTIEDMKFLAKEKGGVCLSKKYVNLKTPLKWKCAKGHMWIASGGSIKNGSWCKHCAGRVRFVMKDVRGLARLKDGKCLSKKYVNSQTKLKFKCRHGHEWKATPSSIRLGHWCFKCAAKERAKKRKLTIEELQNDARLKGGKLISKRYDLSIVPLVWQCAKGHQWSAVPSSIRFGHWCPYCAGLAKLTLKDMQKLARLKDGKCLSKKYVNSQTKLKWQCEKKHIWYASPGNIRNNGTWCPYCVGQIKPTIEDMQKLASSKGGKCLSKKYFDNRTRLKWQCGQKHVWWASPGSVKHAQSWCPICAQRIQERICRGYFEALFGRKFPKKKLKWLRYKKGRKLELDGYCKSLNLAFEYQGAQHYRQISFFTRNSIFWKKRVLLDRFKSRICKKKGVMLIHVPYTVDPHKMKEYIILACEKRGLNVPNKHIDINHERFKIYSQDDFERLKKIAKSRKGKLLSKKYIGSQAKYQWMCSKAHVWKATMSTILSQGSWCRKCAWKQQGEKTKLTIQYMNKLAMKKRGKCLSKRYVNNKIKLEWLCKEGHRWWAAPSSIKGGSWCPNCGVKKRAAKLKLTIDYMKRLALEKEGRCLSKIYVDSHTKLKWQCKKRHVWKAIPATVVRGHWCGICAREKTKTLVV